MKIYLSRGVKYNSVLPRLDSWNFQIPEALSVISKELMLMVGAEWEYNIWVYRIPKFNWNGKRNSNLFLLQNNKFHFYPRDVYSLKSVTDRAISWNFLFFALLRFFSRDKSNFFSILPPCRVHREKSVHRNRSFLLSEKISCSGRESNPDLPRLVRWLWPRDHHARPKSLLIIDSISDHQIWLTMRCMMWVTYQWIIFTLLFFSFLLLLHRHGN